MPLYTANPIVYFYTIVLAESTFDFYQSTGAVLTQLKGTPPSDTNTTALLPLSGLFSTGPVVSTILMTNNCLPCTETIRVILEMNNNHI